MGNALDQQLIQRIRHSCEGRLGKTAAPVVLLAILVLGLALRASQLDVSLWGDEIQTRERSVNSIGYILTNDKYPLYHVAAHAMLGLADNEVMLRFPSLIAGMATIIVLFLVVRTLYNATAALLAAFLLAVSPYHVYQSQYARFYAFTMLFGLLALFFLQKALTRREWRYWLPYALCGAAGCLSQLVFLPQFAAMSAGAGLWILFSKTSRSNGHVFRSMAVLIAVSACALLPSMLLVRPAGALNLLAKPKVVSAPAAESAETVQVQKTAPEQSEERYYLRLIDQGGYIEFFQRYFWMESPWVWKLLILFGLWGLVDLFRRRTPMPTLILSVLLLPPVPFLYVPVKHWHHERYYCPAFIPALILVCIGIMVVPTFLAGAYCKRRSRRTEAGSSASNHSSTGARMIEALLVCGILAAMFPVAKTAWDTYPIEGWLTKGSLIPMKNPRHDWKSLYCYMSQAVRPGDVIHYGEGIEYVPKYRKYYLPRFLGNEYGLDPYELKRSALTPELMKDLCLSNPLRNLWFTAVFELATKPDFRLLKNFGAMGLSFVSSGNGVGTMLFVLGEPTVNLIENPSFEPDEALPKLPFDAVPRNEVFQGQGSLNVSVARDRPATSFKSLKIAGMPYRVRNGQFDIWNGNAPVGWKVASNAVDSVRKEKREKSNSPCMSIRADSKPMCASQLIPMGLALGRNVAIETEALARQPQQAALVLKYDVAGRTERVKSYHSGNGAWETLHVKAAIPSEADPDTILIELLREPAGEDAVCFDNVAVTLRDAGNMLDPRLTYTLSMMVKHEQITRAGLVPWEKGFVRISYAGADGTRRSVTLGRFRGTRDWFQFVATVFPGRTIPSDAKDLALEIGIDDGSGTLLADNVQFEPKDHVTPFAEGLRLPHDENLALRGLLRQPKQTVSE